MEIKDPAPFFLDEAQQHIGKSPQRPIENVCYTCRYRHIGTPEGDCVYAGLCCYGISGDEDLPPL